MAACAADRPPSMADTHAAATGRGAAETTEPSRAQAQLARRVAETKATVPDTWLRTEVDMTAAVAHAATAASPAPDDVDLVVRAAALALREHPQANGAYRDGRFERYERVNVGVVVDAGDGLTVPTLLDADRRSLAELAAARRALEARVADGSITSPELSAGTLTVFALGADSGVPIITGGQAAALGVGVRAPRAVVRDGAVVARETLDLTLAHDHRVLYGLAAAAFLHAVRARLEQPADL